MFNPSTNRQIASHAVTLVREWRQRGIVGTLGPNASALVGMVESALNRERPRPYTDAELEQLRVNSRRMGRSSLQAAQEIIQKVDVRNREIRQWNRDNLR